MFDTLKHVKVFKEVDVHFYGYFTESVLEMLFGIINIVPDPFHGIGKEGAFDKATLANIKSRVMDIIG